MDLQQITTCRYFETHPEDLLALAQQPSKDIAKRLFRRLVAFSEPGDGAMIMSVFTLMSLHAPWLPKPHLINCARDPLGTKVTVKLCTGSVQAFFWEPMTFGFPLDECIHTFRTIDASFLGLYQVQFEGDKDDQIVNVDFVRNPEYALPVGHVLSPAKFIRTMAMIDKEPVAGTDTFVRASARSQASPDIRGAETIPVSGLPEEDEFPVLEASNGS